MGRGRGDFGTSGFTLVELMVVIVIIGLAAATVVLAMPDPGGSLESEAERFAARAKAARDTAILESRAASIRIDAEGYQVARRVDGEWRPAARLTWSDGTKVAPADIVVRFEPSGLAEPLSLSLSRGERRVAVEIGNDGTIQIRR